MTSPQESPIEHYETERVVYREDIDTIKTGTQKLGLVDKNVNKEEKSGFDQVDSGGLSLECVNDTVRSSTTDQLRSKRLLTNVIDIPYALNSKICLRLNVKDDIFFKDFRMLGEKMGFAKDVTRNLEQSKTNPTNELLHMWSVKPEATVEKLIALLKENDLERMDVVMILDNWVEGKASN